MSEIRYRERSLRKREEKKKMSDVGNQISEIKKKGEDIRCQKSDKKGIAKTQGEVKI